MTYYEQLLVQRGMSLPDHLRVLRDNWVGRTYHYDEVDARPRRQSAFDEVTGQRICSSCNEPKPPEAYSVNRRKVDGRDARCRNCKAQAARRRRGI